MTLCLTLQKCLMLNCAFFLLGAALMTASPGSLPMFLGGRFTVGLGVGAMSMVCPTYVSELSPKHIRGRITGLFQVIVVIGVAVSYWITYGVQHMEPTSTQWRIPVGFQLVPVGLMLCVLPFMKESPRWLATKHRNDQALANLAWIRKTSIDEPSTRAEYDEIIVSVAQEESVVGGRSWKEAFLPGNRIRFFIAFGMFTFQQFGKLTKILIDTGANRKRRTKFCKLLRARHLQGDRDSWRVDLSARVWYLRYRQDCRHGHFHPVRYRAIRSTMVLDDRSCLDEHVSLDHRRDFQHQP
jgi:MFS family permease